MAKIFFILVMILSLVACENSNESIISDDTINSSETTDIINNADNIKLSDILPIDLNNITSIGFKIYERRKEGYGYLDLKVKDEDTIIKIISRIKDAYLYKEIQDFPDRSYDELAFGACYTVTTLYIEDLETKINLTQIANSSFRMSDVNDWSINLEYRKYHLKEDLYLDIYEDLLASSNIPYTTIMNYQYNDSYRSYYTPIIYEDERIKIEANGKYDFELITDTIDGFKENIIKYNLRVYKNDEIIDIDNLQKGAHKLLVEDDLGNSYYFYTEIN